ncbi:MAG TPA: hypothetical protein VK578_20920 [Edaphobacter sp.]|nr:hypothetical protein [Edaphobacter sp.]
MKFPQNQRHAHPCKQLSACLIASLTFVIGCASPGNPHPPSLNLPEIVTDLTAQRVGDQVEFRWTTPSRTSDGIDIKGNIAAELCRQTTFTSPPASSCAPLQRFATAPGPSHALDSLPPPLTADPPALLAYRIQIFNAAGRSAGLSSPVFAAAGAAPPSVQQLHATPTRDGVIIEWQQQTTISPVELDRTLTNPPKAPAPSPTKPKSPLQLTPPNPTEVHLKTPSGQPDAGGTTDPSTRKGETYTYTAQRARSITLHGHQLELRSPTSSPITLVLNDTFPPLVPTGLVAVPAGTGASIDLSWQPGTETDLAGYHVYRQELTASNQPLGSSQRLTQTPVTGPAFHDSSAVAGHHYSYRVTALDTTGNESLPTSPVLETATEP